MRRASLRMFSRRARPRRAAAIVVAALCAALVVACGGGGSGPGAAAAPATCTDAEQKRFVLDVMQDIYFWVDELPADISPEAFATAADLLDALRFQPLDRYSTIADAATESAFFSDSQFIGVGIGLSTRESRVFVTQVFGDGPAAATAIGRGDELLRINGQAVADGLAGEGLSAAFGPNEIGVVVELRVRATSGVEVDYVLFKDLVTIEPVPALEVLEVDGRDVGYLAFRDFVDPAFAALDDAFATLAGAGVRELVLDLRYNGGGLLSVSEYLADLLAGGLEGETFYSRRHNAANSRFDDTSRFLARENALALDRLVVITSGGTASASELVINGISPWLDVTLVGGTTFGKPIGQYGYEFCEQVLRPASFALVNAFGEGDYYEGFSPDCAAEDDLSRALGDPAEAMLAEALDVLRTGTCSTPFAAAADASAPAKRPASAAADVRPGLRGEMGSVW